MLRAKQLAAKKIWRWYSCKKDRRLFANMKANLAKAELHLAAHLLRRLSPLEAELIRDPTVRARVRFRFTAPFPPPLLFKIYLSSSIHSPSSNYSTDHLSPHPSTSTHYFSAHRLIPPHSLAARDACVIMGKARYYDTCLRPHVMEEIGGGAGDKVTRPFEVVDRRDFQRYMAYLDTADPKDGGRGNGWRRVDGGVMLQGEAGGRSGGDLTRMLSMNKTKFEREWKKVLSGVARRRRRKEAESVRAGHGDGGARSRSPTTTHNDGSSDPTGRTRSIGYMSAGTLASQTVRSTHHKRHHHSRTAAAPTSRRNLATHRHLYQSTTAHARPSALAPHSRSPAHSRTPSDSSTSSFTDPDPDDSLFAWVDTLDLADADKWLDDGGDYVVGAVVGYGYGFEVGRGTGKGYGYGGAYGGYGVGLGYLE
ncbi:putative protein CXorf58 [Gonapodya sp. JEL0774]|nr:putative protein CXorf58 [Gonapodya sp. JEL0774]